jgi:hypothetical protein
MPSFQLRCKDEELRAWHRKAARAGTTLSQLVRKLLEEFEVQVVIGQPITHWSLPGRLEFRPGRQNALLRRRIPLRAGVTVAGGCVVFQANWHIS